MIFSVILNYLRPLEEVNQHLESHKAWLVANIKQARIILAGPLDDKSGGLVLANCADRQELEQMMAHDSFISSGVAEYHAHACSPALASLEFPQHWATQAKFL
ncbi:YciI family protein [Herbaspirillum huttiense]|uniref:YciI family protein n=1 Tax=Herbaspirillum huttiense TaxID=863372 RepID=UPI0014170843|nr:YciI family protein [Herbaspirillum huttiense]